MIVGQQVGLYRLLEVWLVQAVLAGRGQGGQQEEVVLLVGRQLGVVRQQMEVRLQQEAQQQQEVQQQQVVQQQLEVGQPREAQ